MDMKDIKRVAIYARKSRDDETEEGLNIQVHELETKAIREGWKYRIFKEVASSQNSERPEWLKLKSDLSYYDAILVKDADRLSRRMGFMEDLQDLLFDNGVYILYLDGSSYDPYKDDDNFNMNMRAFLSKMEYDQIKKRLKRGRLRVAESGGYTGGSEPYGYMWDKNIRAFVVIESEAETVKRMYEMYDQGYRLQQISEALNADQVPTKTGRGNIMPITVKRILNNEFYKGFVCYGKSWQSRTERYDNGRLKTYQRDEPTVRVQGTHEALISPEQWERVQIKLKQNAKKHPRKRGKRLLSGLLRCKKCGNTMTMHVPRPNDVLSVKKCQTPFFIEGVKQICGNRGVKLEVVETLFYEELSKYVDQLEEHLNQIKSGVEALGKPVERPKEPILHKMRGLKQKRESTLDLIIDGLLDKNEGKSRIQKIDKELAHLQSELELLETEEKAETTTPNIDKMEAIIAVLRAILQGRTDIMTIEDLNQLLRSLLERVDYVRQDDDIELNLIFK